MNAILKLNNSSDNSTDEYYTWVVDVSYVGGNNKKRLTVKPSAFSLHYYYEFILTISTHETMPCVPRVPRVSRVSLSHIL